MPMSRLSVHGRGRPVWVVLFMAHLRGVPTAVDRRNGRTGMLRAQTPPPRMIKTEFWSDGNSIHHNVGSINI